MWHRDRKGDVGKGVKRQNRVETGRTQKHMSPNDEFVEIININ